MRRAFLFLLLPSFLCAALAQETKKDAAAKGPDASGAARDGLCRAWLAGKGDQNGERTDSPAFTALAKAAGGADKVAAYCKTSTSGGQGQGQGGGPPTTG